jgi:thioredoxin 1
MPLPSGSPQPASPSAQAIPDIAADIVIEPIAELRSASEFEDCIVRFCSGVLVLFDAAWCAPGRVIWDHLGVIAERKLRFPVRRLDVDAAAGVAGRYGIAGLPSLVFFRSGQIAASRLGEVGRDALERWIDELDEA